MTTLDEYRLKLPARLPVLAELPDAQLRELLTALGLTVAPAKPEPGTWHIVKDGKHAGLPARVFSRIELHIFTPTGSVTAITHPGDWPDLDPATPPARVVPAEPVKMTKRQVGGLYNEMRKTDTDGAAARTHIPEWVYMGEFQKDNITATVNAALKSHGHGPMKGDLIGHMAPVVTREQVGAVVSRGLARTGGYTYARTQDVTDAVMSILDAS